MSSITPIGLTDWRNQKKPFGIKQNDRFLHTFILGQTGVGKSTLIERMAISDIENNRGLCIIDPHGQTAELLLSYIPPSRIKDVIYFDPSDISTTIPFNPFEGIDPGSHHLVVSGLVSIFKRLWKESWGPRLEYILRNALSTLITFPGATLLDIQRLLTEQEYRRTVVAYCTDEYLIRYWALEFEKYSPSVRAEMISSILNKVGVFGSIPALRNVIGKANSGFQFDEVLNTKNILICNLSKGKIGADTSAILGSFIVNAIQIAALSRASIPESFREGFFLYIDELGTFINGSFIGMLSECRKYKLGVILACQFLEQIDEGMRAEIFGNVATLISFRVGQFDAEILTRQFSSVFNENDFINLPRFHIYLKLAIDGSISKPFSATTLKIDISPLSKSLHIKESSMQKYGQVNFNLPIRPNHHNHTPTNAPTSLFD
jgi:hypothetical protein